MMAVLTLDVRSAAKMSRKHKHLYKKTSVYISFNVYSSRNQRRHKRRRPTCWKQTSNGCVQATELESWQMKLISWPCSGHSAKTRTLKTSCVLRPLECMHLAEWRLLTLEDWSALTTQIDMIAY